MFETEECAYNTKAHQLCLALNNIMVLINSMLDAEEIMNRIVVEAARALGCESARIALRVEDQWVLKYLYNLPESLKDTPYSDEELPHAALAMVTRKPVAIDDAYNDNRTNTEIMKAFGIRSVLVLPLMERKNVVGALFFNYQSPVSFDQAEIDYAENLTTAVAIALQNSRLFREQMRISADQKRAEEALKESEKFKQGVIDSLLAHIAVVDGGGTIVTVNRPWVRFAEENGLHDASPVCEGANYLDVCRKAAEESDPLVISALQGIESVIYGRRDEFSLEYPCNSPNQERWFLMNVIRPSSGFGGAVITHLDISARKKVEDQLRHSTEINEATTAKLEAIIGHMDEGVVIAEPAGTIQLLNPAALRLHGYSEIHDSDLNLDRYPEFCELLDEAGESLPVNEWPICRALRGETFTNHEVRVRHRMTGRLLTCSISGGPIRDGEGNVAHALITVRDVTEQKRSEEALRVSEANYRAIFDSANDAIYIHDLTTGKILDVNRRMLEITHYSREEALQLTVPDLSGDPEVTEEDVLAIFKGISEGPKVFDWLGKDRNGRLFWVEVSLKKVELQGEERVVAVVRDISERKEAEESLKKAMDQLTRSNRELEQFAYVASHDLQEPLRMVSSYVELLDRKYRGRLDDKADTYIRFAMDGTRRMQNLIRGLLAYSRISRPEYGSVDTAAVFADATANLATVIRECQAEVVSEKLPVIHGDATQMLQLFQNLISNGIKYRKPGVPPRIVVSAEKGAGEWVFSVRDNGIGIRKEDQSSLFQIFRRLHTQEEYEGTGIGLASCKKIVEQHHGRIWLESAPGEGTAVFFTLPFKESVGLRES